MHQILAAQWLIISLLRRLLVRIANTGSRRRIFDIANHFGWYRFRERADENQFTILAREMFPVLRHTGLRTHANNH